MSNNTNNIVDLSKYRAKKQAVAGRTEIFRSVKPSMCKRAELWCEQAPEKVVEDKRSKQTVRVDEKKNVVKVSPTMASFLRMGTNPIFGELYAIFALNGVSDHDVCNSTRWHADFLEIYDMSYLYAVVSHFRNALIESAEIESAEVGQSASAIARRLELPRKLIVKRAAALNLQPDNRSFFTPKQVATIEKDINQRIAESCESDRINNSPQVGQ